MFLIFCKALASLHESQLCRQNHIKLEYLHELLMTLSWQRTSGGGRNPHKIPRFFCMWTREVPWIAGLAGGRGESPPPLNFATNESEPYKLLKYRIREIIRDFIKFSVVSCPSLVIFLFLCGIRAKTKCLWDYMIGNTCGFCICQG